MSNDEDPQTSMSLEPTLSGLTLGASIGPEGPRGRAALLQGSPPGAMTAPAILGRGSSVGRYFILHELGQGGMGVVYMAYDPELDRRVAIKVLLTGEGGGSLSDGRTRLLREAQALAKLSHPAVVAVHDVGTLGEQVWIAMEFVEGQTLSDWLAAAPRPWQEVLAVFRRAGEGLAAAHAAGIVHRDFKPDNVMVAGDGRVRVMDFGLARAAQQARTVRPLEASLRSHGDLLRSKVTQVGALIGTPSYMAPEQWLGGDGDARTDQFAFCVALWQGLHGERPYEGDTLAEMVMNISTGRRRPPPARSRVPSWLRRTVERGLAVEGKDRWPTMAALLDALATGERRRRRRWALAAALVVAGLVGGAIGLRRWQVERDVVACAEAGRSVRATWNDAARAELRRALQAAGGRHAASTAAQVEATLDAYARAWDDAEGLACLRQRVTRTWDQPTGERAQACLQAARWSLAGLLSAVTDAQGALRAAQAAAGLPTIGDCLDPAWLAHWQVPPHDRETRAAAEAVARRFARVASLQASGRYAEAYALARSLVLRADAVGWGSLGARARIVAGAAAGPAGELAAGARLQEEGLVEAVRAGDESLVADAEIGLTLAAGSWLARHEEGLRWGRLAAARLDRLGEAESLRRAALLRSVGRVHYARGATAEAQDHLERALALYERLAGPEHPETLATLDSLATALFTRDGERAEALWRRTLAIRERALGADHPDVAGSLGSLAVAAYQRRAFAEGRELLERAIAVRERALGPNHLDVARAMNNLAVIRQEQHDFAAAQRLYERALAISEAALPADHPEVGRALVNLGNLYTLRGDQAAAQRMFERGLAIQERSLGADAPELSSALYGLANVHAARGVHAEARRLLERALALRVAEHGPDHRLVADVLFNLAEAHRSLKEYDEAERLHRRVLAMYGRILAADDPEFGFPLMGLGELELTRGRPRAAIAWFERGVQATRSASAAPEAAANNRFGLARALWADRRDLARARALAGEALALYEREAAVFEPQRRRISAWLATLPAR